MTGFYFIKYVVILGLAMFEVGPHAPLSLLITQHVSFETSSNFFFFAFVFPWAEANADKRLILVSPLSFTPGQLSQVFSHSGTWYRYVLAIELWGEMHLFIISMTN